MNILIKTAWLLFFVSATFTLINNTMNLIQLRRIITEYEEISANIHEKKARKPNTDINGKRLGTKYVYYNKSNLRYIVKLRRNNKIIYLGCYDTIEKAMNARDKWLRENDM